jgi:hypothetical protein
MRSDSPISQRKPDAMRRLFTVHRFPDGCLTMRNAAIAILTSILFVSPAWSQSDGAPTSAELGATLRSLIIPCLPDPLVEQNFDWGRQARSPVGLEWKKQGALLKPEVMKQLRNDGHWRKIAMMTKQPEKTLKLEVSNVKSLEPRRLTFAVDLEMPVNLKFEQQIWRSGIRLYSGETRARCRAVLHLECESVSRSEKKPGALLPDIVFRMRVLEAKLNYFDFVVEHTAGVGGDAAKWLGDAVHETIKQWKPSLERNLLDKANAAIVKAGDTKEIRLGLSKLLDGK